MSEPKPRRPCAHDPRNFRRFMGEAAHETVFYGMVNRRCPYAAIPKSAYCVPHTILNDFEHDGNRKDLLNFVGKSIQWFSNGWMFDHKGWRAGRPSLPAWWKSRFN